MEFACLEYKQYKNKVMPYVYIKIHIFYLAYEIYSPLAHLCWLCNPPDTNIQGVQIFEGFIIDGFFFIPMEWCYHMVWFSPKFSCMDPGTLHFLVQKLVFSI